jgi:hypothetical protein
MGKLVNMLQKLYQLYKKNRLHTTFFYNVYQMLIFFFTKSIKFDMLFIQGVFSAQERLTVCHFPNNLQILHRSFAQVAGPVVTNQGRISENCPEQGFQVLLVLHPVVDDFFLEKLQINPVKIRNWDLNSHQMHCDHISLQDHLGVNYIGGGFHWQTEV